MDNNQIDGQKNNKESYCPNSLFDNGTISIGEFKTLEEAMSFPIKEIWCVNRKGDNKFQAYKDQGTRMLLICDWSRSIQDSLKFVLALIHQNGKIHYYDLNDLPLYPEERKNQYEGSLGDQATYTLYHLIENKQYNTNTNMNKKLIRLTESDLHLIVKESVNKILKEVDRHRDGYWKERWAKQKAAKQSDTEKDADTSEKPQKNASSLRKTVIERVITMTIIKPIPNALTEVIQRDIRMAMLATDQKKRKDSGSIKHWASIL